jgi:6-phosphogluconolactonase (cycloisomerase 2 family)
MRFPWALFLLLISAAAMISTPLKAADKHPPASVPPYVIANDDLPPKIPTGSSFFPIGTGGLPQEPVRVTLGGVGSGGGYFATTRVSVLKSPSSACAYISLNGSGEISAVDIQALQDIGNFPASPDDSGFDNGIGLANNGTYLYAIFTTSNTIGTFVVMPGCALQFLGSIPSSGLNGGNLTGVAVRSNLLVVTYGDGSIQSYNVAGGMPVANNDLQNATGYITDNFPVGVDITQDGHFAIFGDASNSTTVEVSDVSSGKLTKTILYHVGPAFNSNNVLLSPDESLLYISNTIHGRVTAAFFDKATGKVTLGCISTKLKGFDEDWAYLGTPVTQLASGTGNALYVAEFGSQSGIAVLGITSSGGKCTLTEAHSSPVVDPNSTSLLSIGVYPPRKF